MAQSRHDRYKWPISHSSAACSGSPRLNDKVTFGRFKGENDEFGFSVGSPEVTELTPATSA